MTTTTTTTAAANGHAHAHHSHHNGASHTHHHHHHGPLTEKHLNPAIVSASYAVRGPLATKAEQYRAHIKAKGDAHQLPFKSVVTANIGNPQQQGLDQPPITFFRQVAALTEYPPLVDDPRAEALFPADVRARARELLQEVGSTGAYSHSQGVPAIRQHVADFITARDNLPPELASKPENIFLTAGASQGVSLILQILSTKQTGILIPIPQYPLYTATLAALDTNALPYHLNEGDDWGLDPASVEQAIADAHEKGISPRALVVINPGNPTGSVLHKPVMKAILDICAKNHLVLLADEVYQVNIHDPTREWVSFSSLARKEPSDPKMAIVSFHSISKGVAGECGRRGGYFELLNFPPEVTAQIYKMASVGLCPPVQGQIAVDCLVRPPKQGDPSWELYEQESTAIARALKERTETMVSRLNALEGISCQPSSGALYVYPQLFLPPRAVEEAKKHKQEADEYYAECLLDQTGICVTPGSGFGQKEGEAHIRLTVLCPGVDEYVGRIERFHRAFMQKWA
ncbi:transaminase [Dacryopinax primogenitus]|uniref:Glutamate pyruvate transaminase n=1 Tax=Dacryopinax primogenitus (strain DJM 731) TaxID=1858805 RepID=M5FV20_DACPD|nr:transaminase [Dacryopinax primogenitus]EJU01616.1 transaminase [Dacryopinax primogenitus]